MREWKLAGVLRQCQRLAVLELSRNAIGAAGAGRLGELLRECPALRRRGRFEAVSMRVVERCFGG
eukprot:1188320-Rhodomonas_salina.2